MRRLLRWLRSLAQRGRTYDPVRRTGLLYDPVFAASSFRPGERVDPLAATLEE